MMDGEPPLEWAYHALAVALGLVVVGVLLMLLPT